MDDREIDARLTKIEKALDILLDLEGIYWDRSINDYRQEEETQEQETDNPKVQPKEEQTEWEITKKNSWNNT